MTTLVLNSSNATNAVIQEGSPEYWNVNDNTVVNEYTITTTPEYYEVDYNTLIEQYTITSGGALTPVHTSVEDHFNGTYACCFYDGYVLKMDDANTLRLILESDNSLTTIATGWSSVNDAFCDMIIVSNIIYCLPHTSNQTFIGKIDMTTPLSPVFSQISTTGVTFETNGTDHFRTPKGACYIPSRNKIYYTSRHDMQIFDVLTETVTSVILPTNNAFYGAPMWNENKPNSLYMCGFHPSGDLFEYDIDTFTLLNKIATTNTNIGDYYGGNSLPGTNYIYLSPHYATVPSKIDVTTNTITHLTGNDTTNHTYAYTKSVLLPNGYIVYSPYRDSYISYLNTADDVFTNFVTVPFTSHGYINGVVINDNKCRLISNYATTDEVVEFTGGATRSANTTISNINTVVQNPTNTPTANSNAPDGVSIDVTGNVETFEITTVTINSSTFYPEVQTQSPNTELSNTTNNYNSYTEVLPSTNTTTVVTNTNGNIVTYNDTIQTVTVIYHPEVTAENAHNGELEFDVQWHCFLNNSKKFKVSCSLDSYFTDNPLSDIGFIKLNLRNSNNENRIVGLISPIENNGKYKYKTISSISTQISFPDDNKIKVSFQKLNGDMITDMPHYILKLGFQQI